MNFSKVLVITEVCQAKLEATGAAPGILELDEGERGSSTVFQVDVGNLAELEEQVLDVFGADVGRQIAHIDASFVIARTHRD